MNGNIVSSTLYLTYYLCVSAKACQANTPATMNMIPPTIAVADLLSGLPSMKRVHFIPTVETSSATAESKMLSSITALVAWTSARGGEVDMLVHIYTVNFSLIQSVIAGPDHCSVCLSIRAYYSCYFTKLSFSGLPCVGLTFELCQQHKRIKNKAEINV